MVLELLYVVYLVLVGKVKYDETFTSVTMNEKPLYELT